jgi:autotransporter-associated beta strand protein
MNEQNKHKTTQDNKGLLADLEPKGEVVGGMLSKVEPGTLVLTNANTYTGQTTVRSNGNLQIADLTSVVIDP